MNAQLRQIVHDLMILSLAGILGHAIAAKGYRDRLYEAQQQAGRSMAYASAAGNLFSACNQRLQ